MPAPVRTRPQWRFAGTGQGKTRKADRQRGSSSSSDESTEAREFICSFKFGLSNVPACLSLSRLSSLSNVSLMDKLDKPEARRCRSVGICSCSPTCVDSRQPSLIDCVMVKCWSRNSFRCGIRANVDYQSITAAPLQEHLGMRPPTSTTSLGIVVAVVGTVVSTSNTYMAAVVLNVAQVHPFRQVVGVRTVEPRFRKRDILVTNWMQCRCSRA